MNKLVGDARRYAVLRELKLRAEVEGLVAELTNIRAQISKALRLRDPIARVMLVQQLQERYGTTRVTFDRTNGELIAERRALGMS